MKNSIFLAAAVIVLLSCHLISQVTQEWVARYNGPGNYVDQAYAIAVDASGNVYVAGESAGPGNFDYATVKYNPNGVQQWVQRYNGPGDSIDVAVGIAVDASGNVYVTGYSGGAGTRLDYATIKYNPAGVQQWIARYNGTMNWGDQASSIAIDGSSNIIVTGSSYNSGSGNDYTTISYSSMGVQQWVSIFSTIRTDIATSLSIDSSNNVYVTGSKGPGSTPKYGTVKYNSNGVEQWVETYSTGSGDWNAATFIASDNSGNSYVTGWGWGTFATVKYSTLGIQQWAQRYGFGNGAHGTSIAIDGVGNVYVAGVNISSAAVIKYDMNGVQQWDKTFAGTANALKTDSQGNVYVTGSDAMDLLITKYNSSGFLQWAQTYNGPGNTGNDAGLSIALDAQGNVYITGFSDGAGSNMDFVTIKYSQPTGIQPISSEIPKSYSLYQNYPNPFNPSTKIRFDIPPVGQRHAFDVRLNVYDILGREVAVLINEQLSPGIYEISWDASNYPSSVYYYKLVSGYYSDTKKMILIK